LYSGVLPEGSHEVVWLGMDNDGNPLPAGEYLLRVAGTHGQDHRIFELRR
jgi:hypothetical protein